MTHYDYICDACGFTSEEERGVYNCPVCGNQMRAARMGRYGDNNSSTGRYLVDIIVFILVTSFGIGFLGPIGIILGIIVTIIVNHLLKGNTQDKAIRAGPSFPNPNKTYTCGSCGKNFKGQRQNCPHCGIKLTY